MAAATIELRDFALTTVSHSECASSTCPDEVLGYGAAAISATMRLERFLIQNAATCGVFVAPLATFGEADEPEEPPFLELASGMVSEAVIGACVQVDGYDLSRLTDDVAYSATGTNLDTTMLPVPGTVGAAGP